MSSSFWYNILLYWGDIMKKIELLSPVGNMDMLKAAVNNGADAVYLAGVKYGARAYADNFGKDDLIRAIKYCHLYGVKIYITINTLIYQSEIKDFIKYVEFLYVNGVDAVIMQDIGMISLVRKKFPNLEIHASTQCHNHNEEGIRLLKELGVTRVVMAREMSLNEINNINVDIEKEVFVYGALCVCYSGCCLFSSLNGGRSGNRGECVGSCRLPYKLVKNNKVLDIDDKYLLSTKELNTLDYVGKLIDSNIDSLKIEGRMKSPYYVGYVTRLYRTLIDKYYDGEEARLSKEEIVNLKKLFNREFTKGYLFNDDDIMNIKSPNHQGIVIGKVIRSDNKYIYIRLDKDNLYREDGIRFKNSNRGMMVNKLYNDRLLLVNNIDIGNIAVVDNKFKIGDNDIVLKTIDKNLIDNISCCDDKKIDIVFDCKAYIGKRLEISISDNDGNRVTKYGDIVEESINRDVSYDNIVKCLSKVFDTPFRINKINILKDDNIFVGLKNINEVRRSLVNELINIRENKRVDIVLNDIVDSNINNKDNNKYLNVLVRDEEQLRCCLDNDIDNIYVSDYDLYVKYKNYNNIYYRVSRVNNKYREFNSSNLLVGELGSVYKYGNSNNVVGDYYLNVTNGESIKLLNKYNVKRVTLSVELSDNEIKNIMYYNYNVEMIIYGRLELMVMKYCIFKEVLNYCSLCKSSNDKFYLEDRFGNRYPVIRDNCINHIMHHDNIDKINDINKYINMGINSYRLELFDEDYNECKRLIDRVRRYINN